MGVPGNLRAQNTLVAELEGMLPPVSLKADPLPTG
jgi:hypothetical protein